MPTDMLSIAAMYKTNGSLFEKAIQGVPEEQWLSRPVNDCNHLLWVVGHITFYRGVTLKLAGQTPVPFAWEKLFARGSQLVSPEEYPKVSEIQQAWAEVSAKLTESLPSASADVLGKPAAERSPSLDGTVGGTVGFLCLHETYHVGQMGLLRKLLGFGQAVG